MVILRRQALHEKFYTGSALFGQLALRSFAHSPYRLLRPGWLKASRVSILGVQRLWGLRKGLQHGRTRAAGAQRGLKNRRACEKCLGRQKVNQK